DALGHRFREAVQGRRRREHAGERVRVVGGQLVRVQAVSQAVDQVVWSGERALQGNLLIENHADEQGQRVAVEQGVGVRLLAERETYTRQVIPVRLRRGLSIRRLTHGCPAQSTA